MSSQELVLMVAYLEPRGDIAFITSGQNNRVYLLLRTILEFRSSPGYLRHPLHHLLTKVNKPPKMITKKKTPP